MADPSDDAQFEAAEARGRAMFETGIRATSARYEAGRLAIELVNGCLYAVPVRLIQDLANAGDDDLAGVAIDGLGLNLHWPALDVDLYVPALIGGIFGSREWMKRELARVAGRRSSAAKRRLQGQMAPRVVGRARQVDHARAFASPNGRPMTGVDGAAISRGSIAPA